MNRKEHDLSSSSPDTPRLLVEALQFARSGPYSFALEHRGCAGLNGVSGVGKTRLLRALADIDPSQGRVALNGRPREQFAAPQWRCLVAMIPAESRWWLPAVEDHLPPGYDQQRADDLVHSCGFESDILRWDVTRLSTGEKQRLSLVRALIRDPQVLLLDEVGSGLDKDNGALLETLVRNYLNGSGGAALWVSHNPEQLERVATQTMTMHSDHLTFSEHGQLETFEGGRAEE